MSSTDFFNDAEKFINDRKKELDSYAKSLKSSFSNKDFIISALVTLLKIKMKDRGDSGYTDSADYGNEAAVRSIAEGMYDSKEFRPTEDGSGSISLALLGGILIEDKDSVFAFIKRSSDAVDYELSKREVLLADIKSLSEELKIILSSIDPTWYDSKLMSLLKSASHSLNDSSSTMDKILAKVNRKIIDQKLVLELEDSINDSILFLNNKKALKDMMDLGYIVDNIEAKLDELEELDIACNRLLDGLHSSKSSFDESTSASSRIFEHYKKTMATIDEYIDSVKGQIDLVVDKGLDQNVAMNISRWISELSSCRELLSSSITDYSSSINDPSNPNTVMLDDMILSLGSIGSPVDETIVSNLRLAIRQARHMSFMPVSYPPVESIINDAIFSIDYDTVKIGEVRNATRVYQPSIISQVTAYIDLIVALKQDHLLDMIIHSQWGDILKMAVGEVSSVGAMRSGMTSLLGEIIDRNLRERLLDVFYQIHAMHSSEAIMSLSHDVLKQEAIDDIVNHRIPELNKLSHSIDELKKEV